MTLMSSVEASASTDDFVLPSERRITSRSWPDDKIEQLCTLRAQGRSYDEIAEIMNVTKNAVAGQLNTLRCRNQVIASPALGSIPEDFVVVAEGKTVAEVAAHYGVTFSRAKQWRLQCGMRVRGAAAPEGFAAIARDVSTYELAGRYDVSPSTIKRWRTSLGLPNPRPKNFIVRTTSTNFNGAHCDASREGKAANFLRRFGPVYRCNEHGRATDAGTHWSRAGHVLTGDEIIQRAERLGWNPDEWKEIRK